MMSEPKKRQAFSIQEMGHSSPSQCPNAALATGLGSALSTLNC